MGLRLKDTGTVIDALRATRKADDIITTLREGSFEARRERLARLVESTDWQYGPADLVSTYPHHVVAKTRDGRLVRAEWSQDEQGQVSLKHPKVFETATPVHDIGHELFATARRAVDMVLAESTDDLQPMLRSISQALDTQGDLRRRIDTEIAVRSINRTASWHRVVREHFDGKLRTPPPMKTEGDEIARRSTADLLAALREAAAVASGAVKALAARKLDQQVEALAHDIAADIANGVSALMNVNQDNELEMVHVYEAVVAVSDHLLSGADFLAALTKTTE